MGKLKRVSTVAKKVYLTSNGLESTKSELDYLRNLKRQEVAERIEAAREAADDEENSEYDAALEEQALLENRIAYLEGILHDAKVINHTSGAEFVIVGSTVRVELNGRVDEFMIVGKVEANPIKKRISNESPVGSALLGARTGDTLEIKTPASQLFCKVLSIS